MKKGFCLKKTIVSIFIVILLGGNLYLYLMFKNVDEKLTLKEKNEKALWECISNCNKKKAKGGECYCIQTEKKIRVY
jgi:hypothetical protein